MSDLYDKTMGETRDISTPACEFTLTLSGRASLHARPAAALVQVAGRFACDVRVAKAGGGVANGKSILGILGLDVGPGATVTIRTEGEDAEQALACIRALAESDFVGTE